MSSRRTSTLAFVLAAALVHALGVAGAFGQELIFADGFESGDATAWSFATEMCGNGIDDDGDGYFDCDDFDCTGVNPCGPESCTNGRDDDGDTFVDCDDFDCIGVNPCGPESCDNGTDDDGDSYVDCEDYDCTGVPPCP